jgi:uncharacterized membrane protein YoaK (UPF0700 family)
MGAIFLALLAALAGYVDTAGYLALHGLFTAHVTGNFVTIGAAALAGSSSGFVKLLALPTFCAVVAATRIAQSALPGGGTNSAALLLGLEAVLLAAACGFALWFGPFAERDEARQMWTGLPLVAAMAVQNGVQRAHWAKLPATTAMTSNATQLVLDVVDLVRWPRADDRPEVRARAKSIAISVGAFAAGCAAAAGCFSVAGNACFLLPPAVAILAVVLVLGASRP